MSVKKKLKSAKPHSEITLHLVPEGAKDAVLKPLDCKSKDQFVVCQIKTEGAMKLYYEITLSAKQLCEVIDGLMLTHLSELNPGPLIIGDPREHLNKKYKYLGRLQGFCPIWAKQ